jgi:hypothetical protein
MESLLLAVCSLEKQIVGGAPYNHNPTVLAKKLNLAYT